MMSEMRLRRWGKGEVSGRENWEGGKKKQAERKERKWLAAGALGAEPPAL